MMSKDMKILEKKLEGTMSEFKKFILKGNIIDMAVGVIIGGAFSKIVTSLVNDILMPALGAVTGGASFNTLKYVIHPAVFDEAGNVVTAEAAILYGSFIQNIVDFLIIGFCMFFMVKAIAMVTAKFRHEADVERHFIWVESLSGNVGGAVDRCCHLAEREIAERSRYGLIVVAADFIVARKVGEENIALDSRLKKNGK